METQAAVKRTHKDWRRELKKLRRKKLRQKSARERDKKLDDEEQSKLNDPVYKSWLEEQEAFAAFQKETEERLHEEEEERWLRRELLAQEKFRKEEQKRKAVEAEREAERIKIQKEFEERLKQAEERRAEKKRLEEEHKRKQELLQQKIEEYISGEGELPKELRDNIETKPGAELCPFYSKSSSCRYGSTCSRNHIRPQISRILLLKHLFNHIRLQQDRNTEYGSDFGLEFTDKDMDADYKEFFDDVVVELEKFGRIKNVRTCKNFEAHLRGNVFVEYESLRDALKACRQLQGRYYAGKAINVEFSPIISWKLAICGLSFANKCPKGRKCNYLHIFNNPGNKYSEPILVGANSFRGGDSQRSRRNGSKTPSGWNDVDDDQRSRRNWRWSESPEIELKSDSRVKRSDSRRSRDRQSTRSRSRSRSRSRHSLSNRRTSHHRKKARNRSRSRSSSRRKTSRRSRSKSPRKSGSGSSKANGKRKNEE